MVKIFRVPTSGSSTIDWDNFLFACNLDMDGLTNAFGLPVSSPATLIIDNTGTPITIS